MQYLLHIPSSKNQSSRLLSSSNHTLPSMMLMIQFPLSKTRSFPVAEGVDLILIHTSLSSTMDIGGGVICAILRTTFPKPLTGMPQHKRVLIDGKDLNLTTPWLNLLRRKSTWSDLRSLLCTFSCSMSAMLPFHVVFLPQAQEQFWTASTEYQTRTGGPG